MPPRTNVATNTRKHRPNRNVRKVDLSSASSKQSKGRKQAVAALLTAMAMSNTDDD
jgi:hypothetical protein